MEKILPNHIFILRIGKICQWHGWGNAPEQGKYISIVFNNPKHATFIYIYILYVSLQH